jgi:hypothetical protein
MGGFMSSQAPKYAPQYFVGESEEIVRIERQI